MRTKKLVCFRTGLLLLVLTIITSMNIPVFAESTAIKWPSLPTSGLYLPFRPADKAVTTQNPPDFSWPHVAGAEQYHIQISRTVDMSVIQYEKDDLSINYYNFPVEFGKGTWYWRVRFNLAGEWSEWTEPRRFRITEDAVPFPVPDSDTLISRVSSGHPRVWTNSDDLSAFRSYAQTSGKAFYDSLYASVSQSYNTVPAAEPVFPYSTSHPKDAEWNAALNNLRSYSDSAVKRMIDTAFVYLISNEQRFGDSAKAQLLNLASWDPNGSTSYTLQDQVHRNIAYKCAMAYDWCYSLLTEEEKVTIKNMIAARTQTMVDDLVVSAPLYKDPYDSHGWTAFGYIGIISIAMMKEIPEAEDWFKATIPAYINILPPWGGEDGGWCQGTGYWQWSTTSNKELMDVLLSGTGFDLYKKAFSRNEGYFPLYAWPSNEYGVFGDESNETKPGSISALMYKRIAEMTGNPVFNWAADSLGANMSNDLENYFYGAANLTSKPPVDLPNSEIFPDIGWVTMHSSLYDPERVSFYFKSSPYGSYNHSHADQNSFIISAFGEYLAIDSGYYDSYYSNHDRNYTRQTFAHNAITYDGKKGQPIGDLEADGSINGFVTQTDFDAASGDARAAYKGALDRAERHVIYIKPSMFVVLDNLKSAAPEGASFEWNLHAEKSIAIDADQAGAVINNGKANLKTRICYPQNVQATYEEKFLDINGVEIRPEGSFANAPDQKTVRFKMPKAKYTTIVSTLEPYKTGMATQNVVTENFGDYMKLTFNDGTQVFARLKESGEVNTGLYVFDAAAIAVRDDTVLLVSGTKLSKNGIELVNNSKISTVVAGKNILSAYCNDDVSSRVYLPGLTRIRDEKGMDLQVGGDLTDNIAQKGIHFEYSGDYLTMSLEMGSHEFKLNDISVLETVDNTILQLEYDGQASVEYPSAQTDFYGNVMAWGRLPNEEGLYQINEASQGFVFEKYGLPQISVLEKNSAYMFSGNSASLKMNGFSTANKTPVQVMADYDAAKDICTLWNEAENFSETGGGNLRTYDTRTFLSGGMGVTDWVNKGQWIKWSFDVQKAGQYDLILKYVAGWGLPEGTQTTRVVEISGSNYCFEAPTTVDWGTKPENWRAVRVKMGKELTPGKLEMSIWNIIGPMNLDWVGLVQVKDDEIPPTAPQNLRLAAGGDVSAEIAWDASTDNVAVKEYAIFVGGQEKCRVGADKLTYSLDGLLPAKSYNINVAAFDTSDNKSKLSNTLEFTTIDEDAPVWDGASLKLPFLTHSMAKFTWTPATDNSGNISGYKVYRIDAGSKTEIALLNSSEYTVEGLLPGTEYTFKIEALDKAGNESKNGPSMVFRTAGLDSVVVNEVFGNYPEGTLSSSNGWNATTQYGGTAEVTAVEGLEGRYLQLVDPDYDLSSQYRRAFDVTRSFAPVDGKLYFETKFMFREYTPGQDCNLYIYLRYNSYDAVPFILYSGGTFGFEGAVGDSPTTQQYSIPLTSAKLRVPRDQWMTMKVVLDTNTKKYDLSLTADVLKNYTGAVESLATLDRTTGTYTMKGIRFLDHNDSTRIDSINKIQIFSGKYTGKLIFDYMTLSKSCDPCSVSLTTPAEVGMDSEFSVPVGLEYASGVAAQDIIIGYDSNMFEFVGISDVRNGTFVCSTSDDHSKGCVRILSANAGDGNTITGDATLYNTIFRSRNSLGTGKISVLKATVADSMGNEANINSLKSSTVSVYDSAAPYWENGVLEISDMALGNSVLTWSGAADNTGVTGYRIYQDGKLTASTTGDINSFNLEGLENSRTYVFKVEACDAEGNWSVNGPSLEHKYIAKTAVVLKDSKGNPLSGGIVKYFNKGWETLGTTNASGILLLELVCKAYDFNITYEGSEMTIQQDISKNPTVNVQTVEVILQLMDKSGNLLDMGFAEYHDKGWNVIGNTSGGIVKKEMLPGNYMFRMTNNGKHYIQKQDIGNNPVVGFQAKAE